MNDPVLGCFVDGGDQCADVTGLSAGTSRTFTQRAKTIQHVTVAESSAFGLARALGSGFRISHGKK
jgi:hypothetical protein